jgi:ATP-dependent Clp protease ATP-binding subunit ClpC
MFERFTEGAKRVLFFARYEAANRGAITIETEHLLLGIAREATGVAHRTLLLLHVSPENLREDVEARSPAREKMSPSVEIPFTAAAKRVMVAAAEEADRLTHKHIGTEHLLLGALREEASLAAVILAARGVHLGVARDTVARLIAESPDPAPDPTRPIALERVEEIKHLVDQLARMAPNRADALPLAEHIRESLDELLRDFSG